MTTTHTPRTTPLGSVLALFFVFLFRWALDETWDYDHGWVVGETGITCDWDNVREGSLDMPTCSKGICGGHKANDVLPFKVKVRCLCVAGLLSICFVVRGVVFCCCEDDRDLSLSLSL